VSERAVLIEYRDQVAIITLNRPQAYNACNTDIRSGMVDAVWEVANRTDIRVVVLTGSGKAFCAGADLRETFPNNVQIQLHQQYEPALMGLRRLNKVVIAAVNGVAAGIGCSFVAACDLAVMNEDAYMQLAFSKIALVPDGGITWDMVQALGYKRAYRLMIEASKISAQDCLQYGLINEVVKTDALGYALDWAQRLCELSPVANVLTKRVARHAQEHDVHGTFAIESELQLIAGASADCAEGIAAFLEKRKAHYPGK
jgi:2-(1,2-epoxy-1,2-dihydrophenyl)acetyl-CoA isomerase